MRMLIIVFFVSLCSAGCGDIILTSGNTTPAYSSHSRHHRVDPVLTTITDLPRPGECDVKYLLATEIPREIPAVNLPLEWRCKNYNGGSCVCASTISVLRWQNRLDLADALRKICSGGQSASSIQRHVNAIGVRFACTTSGDVAFLDWACRTRRGATIFWKPSHSCTLVDLTATHAVVLDNNHVDRYEYTPRDEFIRRWKGFGGFALTPLLPPSPPLAIPR